MCSCLRVRGRRPASSPLSHGCRAIPRGAIRKLKAQFTNDNMKVLLRVQIDTDMVRLEQCVQNFTRHLADLMSIEVQGQQARLSFFRRLLTSMTGALQVSPNPPSTSTFK